MLGRGGVGGRSQPGATVVVVVLVVLVVLVVPVPVGRSSDDESPPFEPPSRLSVTGECGVTTTTRGRAGATVVRGGDVLVDTASVVVTPRPTCIEPGVATAGRVWVRTSATRAATTTAPAPHPNIQRGGPGRRRPVGAREGRRGLASDPDTGLNLLLEVAHQRSRAPVEGPRT